ncbi:MAG: hypothetical protein MMC33_010126, partial [Icmadophila ericetorum]|nr:hypothetical protein [Icmadophila ericetorum]
MSDRDQSHSPERGHFKRFKLAHGRDWPRWSDLMESKLKSKNRWKLVTGDRTAPTGDVDQRDVDRHESDCAAAVRTMKENLSEDMHTLVIGVNDPKKLWDKLHSTCNQKGQGVVYAILQDMFNYPRKTKAKGYDKPIIQSCAEMKNLMRRLRDSITDEKDIIDSIGVVLWLDSLHGDFDNVISNLLDGDKTMDQMQEILSSHEEKNRSKHDT